MTTISAGIDRKHTRANIKVQDGCDFFCSFCEIPYARGRARSRKFNDIIKEANVLADAGHKELVITGINVGLYKQNNRSLIDIISELEQIDGLSRIRISSIEPTTYSKDLFIKMRGNSKLCRYLHTPMQSGSDRILKMMNRRYKINEFLNFINLARDTVPEICIGTDVIVGFPSETDDDFISTHNILEESPVNYFHVFTYSIRKKARSRDFDHNIPSKTMAQRSKMLRDLSQKKRNGFFDSLKGSKQKVLFEQKKNGLWSGLTDHYVRILLKTNQNLKNKIVDVKITKLEGNNVYGKLI